MIDALDYEYTIRRAHHCTRRGVRGADADIYRKMEHALRAIEPPRTSIKSLDSLQYDYQVAASAVSNHVQGAINTALKEVHDKEEIELLKNLNHRIVNQTDKAIIDGVIKETLDIFIRLKLEAR